MRTRKDKFFDYILDDKNTGKVVLVSILLIIFFQTINFINHYHAASKEYAAREAHYETARETLRILKSMEEDE